MKKSFSDRIGLLDAEKRRNDLTKYFCYAAIFANIVYAIAYSLLDIKILYPQIINILIFNIPFIIAIRLLKKGRYNLAKIIATYSAPLPIIIGSVFFLGKESGLHIYLLLYANLPMVIWTLKYEKYSIPLGFINTFLFIVIQFGNLEQFSLFKLPSEYIAIHAGSCYIISFIVFGSVVYYYQIASDKFEGEIKDQSGKLQTINLQLLNQSEVISETNTQLEERQQQIEEQSEELIVQKEELIRINEELHEVVATKDKFSSIIAHDLKNPLSSVLGFSDLLSKKIADCENEKISKYAKAIHESATRTYNLLENLLIWSRMQKDGIQISPEKINLLFQITDTSHLLENMRKLKQIDLQINIEPDQHVFTDKYMLSTVINNLLSNAIKFTPKEGRIKIDAAPSESSFIKISVSDTGVGISKEDIPNIFRLDKSISTAGTNMETGTGLGLLLCKEFVEKNEGEIWVESTKGKGSQFYFTVMGI